MSVTTRSIISRLASWKISRPAPTATSRIGVDARTRGFNADLVLDTLANLRRNPALLPELVFAWADEATLLRRYTETRRRHPLAPRGRVTEGIEIEQEITAPLARKLPI